MTRQPSFYNYDKYHATLYQISITNPTKNKISCNTTLVYLQTVVLSQTLCPASQIEQALGEVHVYDACIFVDRLYKGLLGRDEQLIALGCCYDKEDIGSGILDGDNSSQSAFLSIYDSKAYKIVAGGGCIVGLRIIPFGVIDIEQGKGGGIGFIVYIAELDECGRVVFETVLFDKEGYEDAIDKRDDIGRVATVEGIVGKGHGYFAMHSVRLVETPYFYEFVATYHITSVLCALLSH